MKEGFKMLKQTFEIEPQIYVPPNHYFDFSTVGIASSMGYKWLTDRALIKLKPYALGGIIIVPEGEPEIGTEQVYIHADRWRGDLDAVVARGIDSFDSLTTEENDDAQLEENRMKKMVGKIRRDLCNGFGMPEDNARKAAQLLYETKFVNDSFF